jgi:hypothetical protein
MGDKGQAPCLDRTQTLGADKTEYIVYFRDDLLIGIIRASFQHNTCKVDGEKAI